MNTTIVTALYDINRNSQDHRTVEQYLEWFKETLKLKAPMVIFIEDKFKSFVIENREAHNTKIIVTDHNEIPYFIYKSKIEEILNSKEYKEKIFHPDRIECKLSMYNVIQYSKFEWLRFAITNKYFDTDFYFWMDAGCSRFFNNSDLNISWPQNLNLIKNNKLLIQGNINTERYIKNWTGEDNYILDSNCILVGTLFGGNSEACIGIANLIKKYFELYLDKNIVNNEQILLGILFKKYPNLFNVYIKLDGYHLPLFKELNKAYK